MVTVNPDAIRAAANPPIKTVDPSQTGFNGLSSEDFLKILVTQLQNQDPSKPMDGDQLLNQISQMRSLQANLELEKSLKSLSLGQQLGSATSFIGKTVTAVTGTNQTEVTGLVEKVQIKDGQTLLRINNADIPLTDVTAVAE